MKGRRMRVFLNTSPPESPNERSNFINESFGEKHSCHVINRNGGEDRLRVSETTSMIQLIGFDSSELSTKFINNEIVSFGSITVVENERITKVDGIRIEIRHRENIFDSLFSMGINMFTKEDG
jgi:hypothetical protein